MSFENYASQVEEPKSVGSVTTNTRQDSIADLQHGQPTFTLYGRVAAGVFGFVGRPFPDLHFSLVISDPYSGILVIDGQPTGTEAGRKNMVRIRTNIYANKLPSQVKGKIPIDIPPDMSGQMFAQKLVRNAQNFVSYTINYDAPAGLSGARMIPGEYNSSSYLSGLLHSVMGYVPSVLSHGYQTPGWETPIPDSYFKDEAIR